MQEDRAFLLRLATAIGRAKTGAEVESDEWLEAARAAAREFRTPSPDMAHEAFFAIRDNIASDSNFRRIVRAMADRALGVSIREAREADPDFDYDDIPV